MSTTRRSTRRLRYLALVGGSCVALLWLTTQLLRGGSPAADASPPFAPNAAATTSPSLAKPSAVPLPVAADTGVGVATVEPEPAREAPPDDSPSAALEAKYSGMSDQELEMRLAELQFAYDLIKQAAVQQRFEDGRFYSEPIERRPGGRTARPPSPPRQDELLHSEIRVPAEGGRVRFWTYLSEAEYPELHERKRELEWLSRRVRD